MKIQLLFFTITILLFLESISKYKDSNLRKFLKKLNLQDIQKIHQFLEDPETDQEKDISTPQDPIEKMINEQAESEGNNLNKNDTSDEPSGEEEEIVPDKSKDNSKVNIKCLWVNKYNVYTLQKLQDKSNDYKKELKDSEGEVIFNFCQNTNSKDELESTVLWKKDENYTKIAGSIEGKDDKNEWAELNDGTEDEGLFIKLSPGEICPTTNEPHQTFLKIICDEDFEKRDFLKNITFEGFYEGSCKHKIIFRSLYGCPMNEFYLLKKLMHDYWYIFAFVLIAFGAFLCFYGHKIIWLTIILVMGIVLCIFVSLIILNFIPSLIDTEKKLWILLASGFGAGVIIGLFIKNQVKLCAAILGGSMGYSISIFAYQIIQNFIEWDTETLYYVTIVVFIILGIVFGIYVYNSTLIIGTSILGGYIAMRGVSSIFGNYLDEKEFIDLIKNDELDELKDIRNGWTFAYLGLWLVLTIAGVFTQCKIYKKKK